MTSGLESSGASARQDRLYRRNGRDGRNGWNGRGGPAERYEHQQSLPAFEERYDACEREISELIAPAVSAERTSYNQLISERADVRLAMEKINRLKRLMAKRAEVEGAASEGAEEATGTRTHISKNTLDELALPERVSRVL